MKTNNFDTSSTGANIELSLSYDSFLAREKWENNFQAVEDAEDTYIYTDFGNVKAEHPDKILCDDTPELRRIMLDDFQGEDDEDLPMIALAELGYEWTDISCNGYDGNRYLQELQRKHGVSFSLPPEWVKISINGYSQGDYGTIYYNSKALEKARGNLPNEDVLRKDFKNMFFDQPIYGMLMINGEEYPYEGDSYKFQRDEWLEDVSKQSGVALGVLRAIVPDEVPYD